MPIEVIDLLKQKNNGSFPLIEAKDVKGGFHQVNNIEERNVIPKEKRIEGMYCYVLNDTIYRLLGGIENSNWIAWNVATKQYVDNQIDSVDTLLEGKADTSHVHGWSELTGKPSTFTPTLGITSSTAFRGDQGLIAYNHSQVAHAPANAEQNVQADWNESNTSSDAYIKNKPTIPIIDVNKAYVDGELNKKADKTSLHNHNNKEVLDGISSAKVTEWNNKSTFSGAYNDLTGIPANFTPMEHRHNASEIDNLPSGGSIDFGANNNWTGTNTFNNLVKIIGNNEVQRMEPASANSACYYAFYKDKQSRSGYFGYGSAYNNTFVIGNEKADADVNVETKGAGKLKTNGHEVATIAYVDNLIGTINTQLENIRNGVLE